MPANPFTDRYWILAYDLPAETRQNGLTKEQKTFLNTMRRDVWAQLRGFGCVPLQQSLWNVREPTKDVVYKGNHMEALDAIKTAVKDWRAKYRTKGFDGVLIDVWPMATDVVGTDWVKQSQIRFIFEALLRAEKVVDRGIHKKTFRTRKFNELELRCEDMRNMFVEDFTTRHARWNEFEQIYMRLKRKMDDHLSKVCR